MPISGKRFNRHRNVASYSTEVTNWHSDASRRRLRGIPQPPLTAAAAAPTAAAERHTASVDHPSPHRHPRPLLSVETTGRSRNSHPDLSGLPRALRLPVTPAPETSIDT